jgi:hypothetical protein
MPGGTIRTCAKLSLPHRKGPHCRFVVGPDVGVTGAEPPKSIGAVPTISQKGWNGQFSTAHRPLNGAGKTIRAAECQGQAPKRKSRLLRCVHKGPLQTTSIAPYRSFPPATPGGARGRAGGLSSLSRHRLVGLRRRHPGDGSRSVYAGGRLAIAARSGAGQQQVRTVRAVRRPEPRAEIQSAVRPRRPRPKCGRPSTGCSTQSMTPAESRNVQDPVSGIFFSVNRPGDRSPRVSRP